MRIIVVEDEQRSREGLCKLIQTIPGDWQIVAQASNGVTAVELILSLKPDVVFTDIKMSAMDGITMVSLVRARNVKTEFVIVSGYADFEFARQLISLDVVEYLLKPVTFNEVSRALDRVKKRIEGVNAQTSTGSLKDKYPNAHPTILKSLNILEAAYAGKINQRDLACELGISPEYFSYLFSKNIGVTFSEFLRRFRVEKAMEMYASGSCPKQEVPYAVGFSDAKYFSQVFRSVTGKSPGEYVRDLKS